jgi:hypothetical protein
MSIHDRTTNTASGNVGKVQPYIDAGIVKLHREEHISFEYYFNEKARIIQSFGGCLLTFPPGDHHVWKTEGLPVTTTDNSSPKRESLHLYRSLSTSPVKWRVDRLPVMIISL